MEKTRIVLLVTIDCLRHDYFINYSRFTRGFFEEQGNIFTNVYANGLGTPTSLASMMTSTYPLMYSMYPDIGCARRTLAEVLGRAGFKNIGVASNPYVSRHFGFNRGFDLYIDYMPVKRVERLAVLDKLRDIVSRYGDRVYRYTQILTPYLKGFALSSLAKYFIDKILVNGGSRRLFLWLHFMDLHFPLAPPFKTMYAEHASPREALLTLSSVASRVSLKLLSGSGGRVRSLYRKALSEVDEYIEGIVEFLARRRILENTMFVFTSDHGELLMDYGVYGHPPFHSEYTLHVPFCIYPRMIDSRVYIEPLRSLIDLAPSITSSLGLDDASAGAPWYGSSRFFTLDDREYIIAETAHTSYNSETCVKNIRYSIITVNEIITYTPRTNLVVVRDRGTDRVKRVAMGEQDERVGNYIKIIKKHMELEKKTWVAEKICRRRRRLIRKQRL